MKTESFFANTAHLENEVVFSRAPSAFATTPHESCSSRYGFIDTQRVVGYLKDEGYQVADARGGLRGRSAEYGMHTIRMRAPFDNRIPGDLFPEIVFTNSHDKSSRGILDLGVYRTACSNGLVVSANAGLSFTIPHIGDQREHVIRAAKRAIEFVPKLTQVVESWSDRRLSDVEVGEFGLRANALRPGKLRYTADCTAIRRDADRTNSLWNVFNRVQENLLQGGVPYRSASGRRMRSRAIGSVRKSLDFNRHLWDLAEEFLPS